MLSNLGSNSSSGGPLALRGRGHKPDAGVQNPWYEVACRSADVNLVQGCNRPGSRFRSAGLEDRPQSRWIRCRRRADLSLAYKRHGTRLGLLGLEHWFDGRRHIGIVAIDDEYGLPRGVRSARRLLQSPDARIVMRTEHDDLRRWMDPQFGREMVGPREDRAVSARLARKSRHQLIVVQPIVIVPGECMEPRQAQRGHRVR